MFLSLKDTGIVINNARQLLLFILNLLSRRTAGALIIPIKRHLLWKFIILTCLSLCVQSVFAINFGDAALRSNLGQGLHVQVPISGAPDDVLVASCFKIKLETLEGDFIAIPHIEFAEPNRADTATLINLSTKELMIEPAVKLSIALTCGASLQREYSLLFDYAELSVAAPVVATAAAVGVASEEPIASNTTAPETKPATAKRVPRTPVTTPRKIVIKNTAAKINTSSSGKDALRVSNEELLPDFASTSPAKLAAQPSGNMEQQRNQENNLATIRLATMLRDESALLETQKEMQDEQKKIQKLEAEIQQLKLQIQKKPQQEQVAPTLLIKLIALVVLLLLSLIGMGLFIAYKARQNRNKIWWDPSAENKKNVEEIVDSLQSSAEEGDLDPSQIIKAPETKPHSATPSEEEINYAQYRTDLSPQYKRKGLPTLEETDSTSFNIFTNRRGQSIQIEEISDITQEAEFWMSVNDPNRAIEILEPQSLDENPSMPITWLYLLDLYQLVGNEKKYSELRIRFKHKFNTNIPHFGEVIDPNNSRNLEDFPHLTSKCCAFWNTNYILPFLESLLVDDRDGERVGFDLPVYRDILLLISICIELERTKKPPSSSTLSKEPKNLQPVLEIKETPIPDKT
ncbi:type IV pilus assembly protein FimV [Solimicrobium silvestre]|uniref:Tfp pilus assembly protein FimV n=1 Tax=Solimicrobium silvestre TaxID=2099400 RepID=A0A2S9GVU2_9BURK|nr:FlxA-like family protein [Solimicrobium silvestre]PRC91834.1 hypothetical protein S2091_3390 [Solimicrobium silvestre]